MRALTPERLLEAWERGFGHGPTTRALLLLAAADPEAGWEELGALPLGERDGHLLALREASFGPHVEGFARCPACTEPLEVVLDAQELRAGVAGAAPAEREAACDSLSLRFRPANSLDLLAAESSSSVEEARRRLAERCLLEARRDGGPVAAQDLTDRDLEALAAAMAEADPGAELLLELRCPACGHGWLEPLEVASFLWTELAAQAQRLLREVHLLARAYGWSEADVLALSPGRRAAYLELVGM